MDLATLSAFADLDGRTGDEAIVLLAENSGGSGHLLYLAVVGLDVSGPMNLATTLVGDRAQVRSLGVAGSRIALDLVEHAPDDPRCCPTRLTTRAYGLKGRDLVLIAKDDRGPLSPAALGRQTWTLTRLDADRTMRGDPVISLVFEGDRVSGSGGCNRYFGDLIAGAPGQATFGPIGSTRMADLKE